MCGKVDVPAPQLWVCLHVPASLSHPPMLTYRGLNWGFDYYKVEIGNVDSCYKNLLKKNQKALFLKQIRTPYNRVF